MKLQFLPALFLIPYNCEFGLLILSVFVSSKRSLLSIVSYIELQNNDKLLYKEELLRNKELLANKELLGNSLDYENTHVNGWDFYCFC